jgi:hypothetical protein
MLEKAYEGVTPKAHVGIEIEGIKIGSPIEKTLLHARTKSSHTNNHQNPPRNLLEIKWVHRQKPFGRYGFTII